LKRNHFEYATADSRQLNAMRRGLRFTTPASVSNAYAATLIGAALNRTRLAHD
jgi:hypothetical protein